MLDIKGEIGAILPEILRFRRELHQHPEIRFQERWTSEKVKAYLSRLPVAVKDGFAGGTGIVGEIGPRKSRLIALRADMDALEIQEATGLPYASQVPGCMHACGHDGHMAMLCGVAALIARHADALKCRVRFIFQPGEEMGRGGRRMVEEGVLEGVDAVFGMHGWPAISVGKMGVRRGIAMAGADWFKITVHGKGCHGAAPDMGVDPVVVAAHMVVGLQSIVSRELNPCEPAVVSVGRLTAGEADNSIPETAEISGTFRTFSAETRETVCAAIKRIVKGLADTYRAQATVTFEENVYVPLRNDPAMSEFACQALRKGLGEDFVLEPEYPSMAAEDFAYYLERVPGAFLWLGTGREQGETPALHSPEYDFNDEAIASGIGAWLSLVTAFNETCRA